MAERIKVKLYTCDRLTMSNKRFTRMTSEVKWFGSHYWIYPKADKKIFSRTAGQIEGKLHTMFLKPWVYKFKD